jgi:CBS domain-containing protein
MTVRDIMWPHVMAVAPDTDVRDLVHMLAANRISGVPVIDRDGDLVGVVSATDVVALAAYGHDASRRRAAGEEGAQDEETASYWRNMESPIEYVMGSVTNVPEFKVSDIMTAAVFSVPSTTPVSELANFLLRGRIHRALVVDDGELVGIVSTFDVLKAVAEQEEGVLI